MMKYAFMSFSTPELNFREMIDAAQSFGYDGVEPRVDAGHLHGCEVDADKEKRRELGRIADDAGIALCCLATSARFADPEAAFDNTERTRQILDLAVDVGAPRLRVFGGPIPEGRDRDTARFSIIESLRALAEPAAARDITICIETHDDWCDPAEIARIVSEVDHPAIAVNWDIMHPVRVAGSTMDAAWETLNPWVRHVHFHDGVTLEDNKLELRPVGDGDIDHRRAVELLMDAGYDGFLSGEWIKWEASPWQEHLPRELNTMKQLEEKG